MSASQDDALRSAIRAAGLRVTRARVTVLRLLSRSGGPVAHSDVTLALSEEGWDRVTLYRNLLALTEAGLLRRVDVGDHVWRFERIPKEPGDHDDDHPHFLCTACGGVTCLDEVGLQVTGGGLPRAIIEGQVAIQLRGLCDGCISIA